MPRKENLSQEEEAICRRLRVFRENLQVARSVFARAIGIPSERLASYEAARAPVRYLVFQAITQRFFINPQWLAGEDAYHTLSGPFNDLGLITESDSHELFSWVYDRCIKTHIQNSEGRALLSPLDEDLTLDTPEISKQDVEELTNIHIITTLLVEEMSEGQLLVCMRKVLTHNGLSEPLKLHWVKVLGEWAMIKLKLAAGQMVEHPKATPPKEL